MNYLQQKKQSMISAKGLIPNIWDYTLYPITFEQVNGSYTVSPYHKIKPQLTENGYLISNMSASAYSSIIWKMKLTEYSKYQIIIGLDKEILKLMNLYITPIIEIPFENRKSCLLYLHNNSIFVANTDYIQTFLCSFSVTYTYIKIIIDENYILIYGGTNLNNFNYIGKYNMNEKQYFNSKNVSFYVQASEINKDTYITLKHYEVKKT